MILPEIELLTPQTHKNITAIPLKTEKKYLDILTLKKGMELGLAEVTECEQSTVNTLIVKNKAITPLILLDGEEVVGGDQNRIINSTILVAPESEAKISVSCSERGRWRYKNKFESSIHIANYNTRRNKLSAMRCEAPVQNEVWSSIDCLERDNSFRSQTSAMSDSYENKKIDLEEILKSFKIVDEQNGILIMENGEIKGFELLLNPEIYIDFHEKILKSYLIDVKVENKESTINTDEAREVIKNAVNSNFEDKQSNGLEEVFEFENEEGLGKVYIYKDEVLHFSYFKKLKETSKTNNPTLNDDVELPIRD